jgi:hypothetical protein
MADLSKCRTGNWLRYISENQYCTFIAKDKYVTVEMYNGQRQLFEEDLTFIVLTTHFMSVCKFIRTGPHWAKEVAGKIVSLTFSDGRAYLAVDDCMPELVGHLHTLQNRYFDLTAEYLKPNIYGIHDPG